MMPIGPQGVDAIMLDRAAVERVHRCPAGTLRRSPCGMRNGDGNAVDSPREPDVCRRRSIP